MAAAPPPPVMPLPRLSTITSSVNETLKYFRENGLLKSSKFCLQCTRWMTHTKDESKVDKYIWRCPSCKKKSQIREDSFWFGQGLSLSSYLYILFCSRRTSVQQNNVLGGEVNFNSFYTWYNLFRDVMSRSLLQAPIQLGGPGVIVEIDESKWRLKRKYNVGRVPHNGQWVFGLIERVTSKVSLIIVNNRPAAELLPYPKDSPSRNHNYI